METKLITKTIKELADEFDGNVEQLHRTISRCNEEIIRLKKENESLEYRIELELWARARAEKRSATSLLVMILYSIFLSIILALRILSTW
jgi:hypothetical protein